MFAFGVDRPNEFREAADQLRKFDRNLPKELRFLLRRAAQPLIREQKAALMRLPGDKRNSGPQSPVDMRREIRRGIRLRLRTGHGRHGAGPIYRIETKMPQDNLAMIPRGLDSEFDGWWSPYYDKTGLGDWVHHNVPGERHGPIGHVPSWFLGPAQDEKIELRQEIVALLKASALEIWMKARTARGFNPPGTWK